MNFCLGMEVTLYIERLDIVCDGIPTTKMWHNYEEDTQNKEHFKLIKFFRNISYV